MLYKSKDPGHTDSLWWGKHATLSEQSERVGSGAIVEIDRGCPLVHHH
jgi:hypothetical protein